MKKIYKKNYPCPVSLALDIVGGKWKSLILFNLKEGPIRFSDLRRMIKPAITEKMLTQELRELEACHLIIRKVYPQVPPKVEYSLTEEAFQVMPVIRELYKFGSSFAKNHKIKVELHQG